jgi:hypothetical protein
VFGFDIEGPFGCVVPRQPRTTTTEPWVVVGGGYIIVVIVILDVWIWIGSVWIGFGCLV